MEIRLLLGKIFLTFLVWLVPYVMYIGAQPNTVQPWVKHIGTFLMGGLAVTSFAAIMIAIWE